MGRYRTLQDEEINIEEIELVNLKQLAKLLKYPSEGALRKAKSRGKLPVKLYKFSGKKNLYAKIQDVKECINNMKEC